jgi:hypothetical protein
MTQKKFPRQSEKHSSAAEREVKGASRGNLRKTFGGEQVQFIKEVSAGKYQASTNFILLTRRRPKTWMVRVPFLLSPPCVTLLGIRNSCRQQAKAVPPDDERVFALQDKHVLIVFVAVRYARPVLKALPETNLTPVSSIENVAFDVLLCTAIQ